MLSTGRAMDFSMKDKRLARGVHLLRLALIAGVIASCTPSDSGPGACDRPDLAFGGDVLLHSLIQSDAAARPEGFAPAFAPLANVLSQASVTVVNLEGPAARNVSPRHRIEADPETRYDGHIYSGYPLFNYHPSIAEVLQQAGVDIVQTANNHAMDRGSVGADLTLSALAEAGLSSTGTHPSDGAAIWHATRQVSGYNIAFLACTFSTNGLSDQRQQSLGCYRNRSFILNLIHTLAEQPDIDGVILLPHWGTEYSNRPTRRQRRLAQAAADAGAIAVVGTHPHVLQPQEMLTAADGRQVPVAFSLGNLISTQWRLERRTGAVYFLDLTRDAAGRLQATDPRYLPTRVERTVDRGVAVFPAAQLATGGPSLAHAQRVLGPGMLLPNGCPAP
ncbi:CapA family protein [Gymnodinialimonas ceratoperidinii]|uniref:CapA family protein n=1 Tax=Gymnodinialimonas ceratoperidinii TaxID=2856823 RepID=A0A8F6YE15_9RHOB|nr:CapA family protein [Gymnodinialimonas ceratoperidinii]QXT41110.1 CapA family protein [Gymnodinialimonas ceratoperidinii]